METKYYECAVCGFAGYCEPSYPLDDAPCPQCNVLLYPADPQPAQPAPMAGYVPETWTKPKLWLVSGAFLFVSLIFPICGYGSGEFRYFTRPTPIAPADVSQRLGQYVTFTAHGATEAGYRYRGTKDPNNKFARLLFVPVGENLLVIQVPLNHAGTTYSGVVQEMPADVHFEAIMATMKAMPDLRQRLKDMIPKFGPDGRVQIPEEPPAPRPLDQRLLPVFVDADRRPGFAVAMVILGVGCFITAATTAILAYRRN